MRIIAIDPGTTQSGAVAFIDGPSCEGVILSNEEMLRWLDSHIRINWSLVIEFPAFYGKNMTAGASVFETCYWIGRFREAWGREIVRVFRQTVKAHVCGSAKAKDAQVNACLRERWGEKGTKVNPNPVMYGLKSHMLPALAVATWYLDTHKKIAT